jgi:hypothetical protein
MAPHNNTNQSDSEGLDFYFHSKLCNFFMFCNRTFHFRLVVPLSAVGLKIKAKRFLWKKEEVLNQRLTIVL